MKDLVPLSLLVQQPSHTENSLMLPSMSGEFSMQTHMVRVSGIRDWWCRIGKPGDPGGVWRTSQGSSEQLLEWCPEVLVRLSALDGHDRSCNEYFAVRVHQHLALLSSSRLVEGHGWEQFPTVDLWQCIALTEQLSAIVHAQARSLPQIEFREAIQ